MIVPEYTPGDWIAVVTDGGIALLPGGTDDRTVRRLWTSMRGDATGLVRHLQELTRDGLTSLPPFALVSVASRQLHAVVRGAVEVAVTDADGARLLTAPQVATWSEQVVQDVVSVTVRTPGAKAAADLPWFPLLSGVAHVETVTVVLGATVPGGAPESPTDGPASERPPRRPVAAARPDRRPDAALVLPPAVPAVASVVRSEVPSPAVPAGISVDDDPSDHTLLRPAQTTDLSGHADTSTDHDGTTVLSSDVVALRRRLPDWAGHAVLAAGRAPVAGPERPAARTTATPARLAMSTGERVPLNRPVLIGRAPQATRVHSTQVPRLLTVPSPLQDISRTHAEVRMDGDDVVLTDLHSTNGVLVVRCDAGPQRLQPGEATVLQPGVLVDLGEGITFTVERGA